MARHYRNYAVEDIHALIAIIEADIEDGLATTADHKQLAELEGELAEREWVLND
jgi:hypothetical protein